MATQNTPAVRNEAAFNLAIMDGDSLDVVRENLESEEFSASDLDRISVPAGGSTVWEVNTPEGLQNVPEFRGVIVMATKGRTFWNKAFGSGDTTPPDCYSLDCKTGIGTPGGDCATCPCNQFGSAQAGGGKACRERRSLYILQEGDLLPTVLNVPASSIKPLKNYMLRLTKGGIALNGCVTSFTLAREVSKNNIKYSGINFQMAERLDKEKKAAIQSYLKAFGTTLENVHRSEVNSDSAGDGSFFGED